MATLDELYTRYESAIDGADYDTAIAVAMKMQAQLAIRPTTQRSDPGSMSMAWKSPNDVQPLIDNARRLKADAAANSSGPWQQSKVRYQRADSRSDY